MGLKTFEAVAAKIRSHAGYICFYQSGEPMMNPDIFEIIACGQEFAQTEIHTNGTVLTDEMCERLVLSGTNISVSVDGMTQEVYEKYRVGGDLQKALWTLRTLKTHHARHGMRNSLRAQFMVFRHNQHEIPAFKAWCATEGIKSVIKVPGLELNPVLEPSNRPGATRPKDVDNCVFFQNVFTILLDGSVVSCYCDYNAENAFGNILEQEVMEIWDSPRFTEFRRDAREGRLPEFCRKGCIFHSVRK